MGIREYFVKRVIQSVIVAFLVLLLNFFLFYMRMPEVSGLAVWEKFESYLKFVFVDGFSTANYRNTLPIIIGKLPFTLLLLGLTFIFSISISLLAGGIAAYKFNKKIDTVLTLVFLSLFFIPSWWLAKIFLKYFHNYFPVGHWYDTRVWSRISPWSNLPGFIQDVLWHMVLPVASFTLSIAGIYFIVIRNSMISCLREDFVTVAVAKGLKTRTIIFKHILRYSFIPILAIAALTPIIVVNEAISIEYVYSLTGVGHLVYWSVISVKGFERSVPTPFLQAIFIILAWITIGIQFAFDLLYHILDPRLRTDGGRLGVRKRRDLKIKIIWTRFKRGLSGIFGLSVLLCFVFMAVFAPYLPLYDPEDCITGMEPVPPNLQNLLGTDEFGRDVLSRLIWGARATLAEFFGALAVATAIGTVIGLIMGYYSEKWFSYLLDRVTDVFIAMPVMIFVVYFPMEPGTIKWILAVGVASWGIIAKMVKSQVLTVKEKAYIETAKAAGASNRYIMIHHLLPELLPVLASSLVYTSGLILALQSSLDFFGFRRLTWSRIEEVRSPSVISWGSMLSYSTINTSFIVSNIWWTVLPPAFCLALLGLSIVFVINKLIYAINPQL
ncbi:MAG: ABC transporter permease subunit [Candidatus Baldrarchaeia archaeon]